MSIITRTEYMKMSGYPAHSALEARMYAYQAHENFFAQFIVNETRAVALRALTKYPIELEFDGNFNDMPVTWWDTYANNTPYNGAIYNQAYPDMSGVIWQSDLMCILKVAALKIMEERGFRKIWRPESSWFNMRMRQRQGTLRFDVTTSEGDVWHTGREIRCIGRYEEDRTMWKVTDKDVAYLATSEIAIIEEEAMRIEEPDGWKEHKP